MKTSTHNTVSVPEETFIKLMQAMNAMGEAQDQLEDFLLLSNKNIVADLRRARREHQKGNVGSWHALKTRYGL